jgi:hypothetical protein
VAVVEQPPKGGDGVTICRDLSHMCIHLAVLCICDAHALYALDWSTVTAQKCVTIYGNGRTLYVRYVLCLCIVLYYMRGVVVYVCVWLQEMTSSDVMAGRRVYDKGTGALRSSSI